MARSAAQAQDAYLERSQRNDKIVTGVLTLIVGLVMVIVVSMVLFILSQGIETLFKPGFLTEASRANGRCCVFGLICARRPYHKHCIDGYRDPFVAAVNRRGHVWLSGL